MNDIKIKLFYEKNGIEETTTLLWKLGDLQIISIEEKNRLSGEVSTLEDNCDLYTNEYDIEMIKSYITICANHLIDIAKETNSTICFKKELWMDLEPAIVESWLEKDNCSMLRKSTRIEYFNNILNSLAI